MYKEASGTLTAAPCMLWLAASGFFCALLLREIYHSRVAPKGYPAARPLSWPTVLTLAIIAAALAWSPASKWRFERFLTAKARILSGSPLATVHCNSVTDTLFDPNVFAAGHANFDTGEIVFNSSWCSRLKKHLRNPEHADLEGIIAVHIFAHEAMHIRGERNEARTECQAIQRHAWAAALLGIPGDLGKQQGLAYYRGPYQQRAGSGAMSSQYYSSDCAPGKALDERLVPSIW